MAAGAFNGIGGRTTPASYDQGSSVTQLGFRITTHKFPILKAGPIEEMTEKLGIAPPEMIFGDNGVSIEHLASGWKIDFNAFDALDCVDKTGETMLKVAHSKEWHQNREQLTEDIKEVIRPFDWSYSTNYTGTFASGPEQRLEKTPVPIPIHLLSRPDPILFFDEVMLYEDELADNGIAMLNVKVRVMPARLLLLSRFFLRLDEVLLRVRDTRIYIEFATGEVVVEYTAKEEAYEAVRLKLASTREDVLAFMRDPNKLAEILPVVDQWRERVVLK